MRKQRVPGVLVLAGGLAGALLLVVAAPAGAVTVSDEAGLRAAFANAAETQIDLANDITLTDCAAGDLDRNSATALTINGNGFTVTQTCPNEGVFQQAGTGGITVDGITITGGTPTGNGGGIDGGDSAPITVTNSTITGNDAGGNGGAVAVTFNSVTVTNSTLSGNDAGGNGGGIAVTSGMVTVTNSTISGNDAGGNGGGIAHNSTTTVTNSTISGNSAGRNGGGLAILGTLELTSSTITENTAAGLGDGIHVGVAGQLVNSIIFAPTPGDTCEAIGTITSSGNNIAGDDTCNLTQPGDQPNTDPELGPLADNGGSTQTHLPQTGSPAIDTASDACPPPATDQRGVSRPQGPSCDIGSVEVEPTGPPAPPAAGPAAPVPAVVRFTG